MRLRTPLAWYRARVKPSLDRQDRAFISAYEPKVRAEKVDAALGVTREHAQQVRRDQLPKARQARAARYCTRHMIVTTPLDGPERLIWVLGQHRTQGNACDGPPGGADQGRSRAGQAGPPGNEAPEGAAGRAEGGASP